MPVLSHANAAATGVVVLAFVVVVAVVVLAIVVAVSVVLVEALLVALVFFRAYSRCLQYNTAQR